MSSRAPLKVVVLMGGISFEREVSLISGREVAAALRNEGYEVIELDAGPDVAMRLSDFSPDVVFNALHGRWGEDGCVQGIADLGYDERQGARPLRRTIQKYIEDKLADEMLKKGYKENLSISVEYKKEDFVFSIRKIKESKTEPNNKALVQNNA